MLTAYSTYSLTNYKLIKITVFTDVIVIMSTIRIEYLSYWNTTGTLEFYANSDGDLTLGNRPILATGWGSSSGVCKDAVTTTDYNSGLKSFQFSTPVCDGGYCARNRTTRQFSMCPRHFDAEQFGKMPKIDPDPNLQIQIDARTLTTALGLWNYDKLTHDVMIDIIIHVKVHINEQSNLFLTFFTLIYKQRSTSVCWNLRTSNRLLGYVDRNRKC